ncbi:MAG: PP0621 family protein [Ramlibacter sp.]|nr:hypothetical protein [Ramlibacter sp.]
MKFVLVLLVIVVAVFVWRGNRRDDARERGAARGRRGSALAPPQDMVSCPVCAVHLPRAEASPGRRGLYCGDDHRRQAEG